MALPRNQVGGTHGTIAPFPVGEKVAHATVDLSGLLGMEIHGLQGECYRLVQLNKAAGLTAALSAKRAFKYTSTADVYDVDVTGSTGDACCGVAVPNQVALDDNDYFWLQVGEAGSRVEVTDSGSGFTAGDLLQPTAAGDVITDASASVADFAKGVTPFMALDTAAADAAGTAVFTRKLH